MAIFHGWVKNLARARGKEGSFESLSMTKEGAISLRFGNVFGGQLDVQLTGAESIGLRQQLQTLDVATAPLRQPDPLPLNKAVARMSTLVRELATVDYDDHELIDGDLDELERLVAAARRDERQRRS